MAVTGEIPDVRTAPARQTAVHPTVVQWPIANVLAKINIRVPRGGDSGAISVAEPYRDASVAPLNPLNKQMSWSLTSYNKVLGAGGITLVFLEP